MTRRSLLAFLVAAALCLALQGSHAATRRAAAGAGDDPMAPVYLVSSRATWDTSLRPLARALDEQRDAVGRPVVISRIRAHNLEDIARHVHQRERRCGGFFAFPSRAEAAAFLARDQSRLAAGAQALASYTIDQQSQVERWLPKVSEQALRQTILSLSTDRPNRYYNSNHGRESAHWIRDTWAALAGDRDDVTVSLHHGCSTCGQQPSVILSIRGTEFPDEIVVLGGHLDSISSTGFHDGMVAPGADDNASGIAVLTEIIRVVMAHDFWRPKRTVQFMGYAAEEVGLRGSRAIAEQYAAAGEQVVGVLQLDMTNYTAGTTLDMRIISDYSNASLQQFVRGLFDTYLAPAGHTRGTSSCGYACSDHASWTAVGYPAVFAAEPVLFPTRHTPTDKMPNVGADAQVSVPFAQLGLAFVAELAKSGRTMPWYPYCPATPAESPNAMSGALPAQASPVTRRRLLRGPAPGPIAPREPRTR